MTATRGQPISMRGETSARCSDLEGSFGTRDEGGSDDSETVSQDDAIDNSEMRRLR